MRFGYKIPENFGPSMAEQNLLYLKSFDFATPFVKNGHVDLFCYSFFVKQYSFCTRNYQYFYHIMVFAAYIHF